MVSESPLRVLPNIALIMATAVALAAATPVFAAERSAAKTSTPEGPAAASGAPAEALPASPGAAGAADHSHAADSTNPAPSEEARALIALVEEEYARGVEAYRAEEMEQALELFNSAVSRLLAATGQLRREPAVETALQDLIDDIHALELESYRDRGRREETPLDALKTIEAFLSPEEAERERRLVEGELPQFTSDLPIVVNDQVLALIAAYQGRLKGQYEAGIRRSGRYIAMMQRIFAEEGLPRDLVYMAQVESTFKVTAYSRARAKGLWQFIASTGRIFGLRNNHWVDERSDPEKATRAAAHYLRALHKRFGDWYLAMAAYNAGEGRIERAIRTLRSRDYWRISRTRLLRRETRNYVPAILASILIMKDPKRYGFDVELDPELRFDTVQVDSPTELRVIAQCAGVSAEDVRVLNPELRRPITPPDQENYTVKLPPDTAVRFAEAFAQVPKDQRLTYTQHQVRTGETLAAIAGRYKTSVSALQRANNIQNRHRLSVGQMLTVPIGPSGEVYSAVAELEEAPTHRARGEKIVHRVRRGETLYRIARRYRTTVDSIRRWNGMGSSSLLRPGRRLIVYYRMRYGQEPPEVNEAPVESGSGSFGEGGGLQHRVRRGDTLSAIARQYGTSIERLCEWNNLTRAAVLIPGTLLSIQID